MTMETHFNAGFAAVWLLKWTDEFGYTIFSWCQFLVSGVQNLDQVSGDQFLVPEAGHQRIGSCVMGLSNRFREWLN